MFILYIEFKSYINIPENYNRYSQNVLLRRKRSNFERWKKNSVDAEWQVNIYLFLSDIEYVCKLITTNSYIYILKYNKIYNT